MTKLIASVFLVILLVPHEEAQAKLVDNSQTAELVIAEPGTSRMVIIVAADAGPWEIRAAVDLAKYIGLMTGAHLPIVNWASDQRPGILIGKAAVMADPQTRSALQRVAKNDPVVQADAISVRRQGNQAAQRLIQEVFQTVPRRWRGMGDIPYSGFGLRPAYAAFDAERCFGLAQYAAETASECISGLVLQGRKRPYECPAFGTRCTPDHPLGAPMVSSEGACAAYYRYRRLQSPVAAALPEGG